MQGALFAYLVSFYFVCFGSGLSLFSRLAWSLIPLPQPPVRWLQVRDTMPSLVLMAMTASLLLPV